MKLTRRKLAAALAAPALAAAEAQTQTPPAGPLASARDRIRANSEALAQKTLPMTVEPAFQFKA